MANITYALLIVLAINAMFFLGQAAMESVVAENDLSDAPTLLNCKGTLFEQADVNGCNDIDLAEVDTENAASKLPSAPGSISPQTGNIFTDTWSALKTWFTQSTGLGYLSAFVSALPNFLKSLGLPNPFVFAIGALWYLLAIFLVIAFFRGGGD